MRKLFLSAACVLALTGCMSAQQNATTTTEYTCAAATAALKTLIVVNDKLTQAQRDTVTQAVAVTNPVCSQPTVPTLSTTAQAALTGALTTLTNLATTVK